MRSPWLPTGVLVAALAAASPSAAQEPVDAAGLMREGNALVRSGLYRAALLRYREAESAGADSPLFHYNVGVVYYRLEQYADAVVELRLAARDAELAPLATYNLALAELAGGREPEALAAFRAVIDMGAAPQLRRASREAIARIEGGASESRRVDTQESRRARGRSARDERPAGDLRMLAVARYAQDDNVYRSPSRPYVDLANPAQPTVTPVVYSSGFVPVDVLVEYALPNEAEDTEFIFAYALDGDFYDSEFSNANRVSQRFSIGADIELDSRDDRRRRLDSAFFVRSHDETSFNPDDGLDRTLAGVDVSDRFEYRSAGTEVAYAHDLGRWEFGFDLDFERRQYADTAQLMNYDHEFFDTLLGVDYALNARTSLSVDLRRFRRVYDERRARDLTGAVLPTNETVEYDYSGLTFGFERRLGRSFVIEADLARLERTDEFLGYYDYARNSARVGLVYRPNRRLRVSASWLASAYDYPNAFAYNVPAGGPRELDTQSVDAELEYAFTVRLALWAAIEIDDVESTDARNEYARSIAMVGVRWRRR